MVDVVSLLVVGDVVLSGVLDPSLLEDGGGILHVDAGIADVLVGRQIESFEVESGIAVESSVSLSARFASEEKLEGRVATVATRARIDDPRGKVNGNGPCHVKPVTAHAKYVVDVTVPSFSAGVTLGGVWASANVTAVVQLQQRSEHTVAELGTVVGEQLHGPAMLEEDLLLECLRDGVGFLVRQEDVDVPSGCPVCNMQYVAHAIDFDKRTNEVNA